jgi:hypothetical protein
MYELIVIIINKKLLILLTPCAANSQHQVHEIASKQCIGTGAALISCGSRELVADAPAIPPVCLLLRVIRFDSITITTCLTQVFLMTK